MLATRPKVPCRSRQRSLELTGPSELSSLLPPPHHPTIETGVVMLDQFVPDVRGRSRRRRRRRDRACPVQAPQQERRAWSGCGREMMVTYIRSDLDFILAQIKIAEDHALYEQTGGTQGKPLFGANGS